MKSLDPLRRLERSLESLIERPINRVFGNTIQPVEIARRLEREMQERRLIGPGGAIVPNVFNVSLSPSDFAPMSDYLESVNAEIVDALEQFADARRFALSGPILVTLREQAQTARGQLDVEASVRYADHVAETPPQSLFSQTQPFQVQQQDADNLELTLAVLNGSMAGVAFTLAKRSTLVGRSLECDIVLQSPDVSRRHAVIEREDGVVRIVDLASMNGTFVNRRRVTDWAILKINDVVTFGEVDVVFEEDGYAAYRPPELPT